jgi:predicted outer membrane repeat protein
MPNALWPLTSDFLPVLAVTPDAWLHYLRHMRKSVIARLIAVTTGLMLVALGTLNSNVGTRRVRAFTVLTVTNTNDNGTGSLRDAINTAAPGDTIMFNLSLPATIALTTGEVDISQNLTIAGPGANLLTVSGNNSSRAFSVGLGGALSISGLTIAHGSAPAVFGGAIFSKGALSVTNCILSNNTSGVGGAIATEIAGSLTVAGCTFVGNSAVGNGGAILASEVPCTVINSTFSGNSGHDGGALYIDNQGTIVNCTISGNSAEASGGGGIFVTEGTLNLQNTIIGGNTGGDCKLFLGPTIGTNSHNLIEDGSCSPMLSGNPMLGPLQNSGGPTPTMALIAGSPAIDAGDDSVLGSPLFLTTDQRGAGFPRKLGAHVDIGAFESQAPSFDTCLKDNNTGNLFQFNSVTGLYQFTRCSDSFTLSGTGVVAMVNGLRTLTDFKADRKISAGFNIGQLTGSATIYLKVGPGIWQLCRVHDTNPSAVCKC